MGRSVGSLHSRGGYVLDEVVSALQKSIRRGQEREAMYWAIELEDSGYSAWLWRRLLVIATEDIGLANPTLVGTIAALRLAVEDMRKVSAEKKVDEDTLAFAVLALCRSPKSRETDEFVNQVRRERRLGWRLEVPDHALDQHTSRGRAMGRGPAHFWSVGAHIEHEAYPSAYQGYVPGVGDGYRDDAGRRVQEAAPTSDDAQPKLF